MSKSFFTFIFLVGLSLPLMAGADAKITSMKNKLYGDFRYSFNSINTSSSSISAVNNASRLGLKGEFNTDIGIKTFYHGQLGLNPDSTSATTISRRFFFGGIKGKLGKVLYGTVSSPYKLGGFKVDPFYDTMAGVGNAGRTHGMSRLTNGFMDNTLAYFTPTVNGFHANLATYIDDSAADDHSFDFGLWYDKGPIHLVAQYMNNNPNVLTAIRLRGQYKTDKYSVAINYETIDENLSENQDFIQINGTYNIWEGHLAASYGSIDGSGSETEGANFTVGYFHHILKHTQMYFLYSDTNNDVGSDRSVFSLGFSQKFSIGS